MFGNFQVNIKCSSFFKAVVFWSTDLRFHIRRIQQRSFSSCQAHKNMCRFYNKDIEILVTWLLKLKLFEVVYLYNFETTEAVTWSFFIEKILLIAEFVGKHLCWSLFFFFNWLREEKRKVLAQASSRKFCEIYQNTNFEEYLRTAVMTKMFYSGVTW